MRADANFVPRRSARSHSIETSAAPASHPFYTFVGWLVTAIAPLVYLMSIGIINDAHFEPDGAHLDLRVYRDAVTAWRGGEELYELKVTEVELPFMYPPIAAILFQPLAALPLSITQWVWLGSSVIAFYIVVFLSFRFMTPRVPLHTRGIVASVGLFIFMPVWQNSLFGQINILLMLLICLDWLALKRARGTLIGVAASIKVAPGMFLLLYVIHRRWKEVIYGLVTFITIALVTLVLARKETLDFFLRIMWDPNKSGPPGYVTNQSLRGVLTRLGVESTGIWIIVAMLALALGCYALYRVRFTHPTLQLLVVAITGLLVSPISWGHHWVWVAIVPAAALYLWRSRAWVPLFGALLLLLALSTWIFGDLVEIRDWSEIGFFTVAIESNPYAISAVLFLISIAVFSPRERSLQQTHWTSGAADETQQEMQSGEAADTPAARGISGPSTGVPDKESA